MAKRKSKAPRPERQLDPSAAGTQAGRMLSETTNPYAFAQAFADACWQSKILHFIQALDSTAVACRARIDAGKGGA